MKPVLLIFAPMAMTFTPALAQDVPTVEQCESWLTKADTNGDGSIGKGKNVKFVEMMNKGSSTVKDEETIIDKAAFIEACQKGTFGMPTG